MDLLDEPNTKNENKTEPRVGFGVVDGKMSMVKLPTELRDNIPLDSSDETVAVKVKETQNTEIIGFESLPIEIQELLKLNKKQ